MLGSNVQKGDIKRLKNTNKRVCSTIEVFVKESVKEVVYRRVRKKTTIIISIINNSSNLNGKIGCLSLIVTCLYFKPNHPLPFCP